MMGFAVLGEEIVNMYRDRDALMASLKAFAGTLMDEGRQAGAEREHASAERKGELAEQKRELAQMIRQFTQESKAQAKEVGTLLQEAAEARTQEVRTLLKEAAEMIRRFHAESAELAAGWNHLLASIPRRSLPSAARRAPRMAGETVREEVPVERPRGRRKARET